jgi:hypothetical protein
MRGKFEDERDMQAWILHSHSAENRGQRMKRNDVILWTAVLKTLFGCLRQCLFLLAQCDDPPGYRAKDAQEEDEENDHSPRSRSQSRAKGISMTMAAVDKENRETVQRSGDDALEHGEPPRSPTDESTHECASNSNPDQICTASDVWDGMHTKQKIRWKELENDQQAECHKDPSSVHTDNLFQVTFFQLRTLQSMECCIFRVQLFVQNVDHV